MEKNLYIIIGRSGCGKGTQAALIKNEFEEKFNQDMKHITTGGNFRDFIEKDMYTAKHSKEIIDGGGLMPEFLSIWGWTNLFIDKIGKDTSVILDGAPRRLIEVDALNSAVDFYGFKKPVVIYLDVSEEWARKRLVERGREDDSNEEEINRKMVWFESDVKKVIERYAANPNYDFIQINGEGTVEEVHVAIMKKLNF